MRACVCVCVIFFFLVGWFCFVFLLLLLLFVFLFFCFFGGGWGGGGGFVWFGAFGLLVVVFYLEFEHLRAEPRCFALYKGRPDKGRLVTFLTVL